MITTERKYPKSVKEIHILGSGARECKKVVIDVEEDRPRRVSKRYRDLESEIRAVSQASRRYHDTYLELHDASNEEKKNGSLKDLPDNVEVRCDDPHILGSLMLYARGASESCPDR